MSARNKFLVAVAVGVAMFTATSATLPALAEPTVSSGPTVVVDGVTIDRSHGPVAIVTEARSGKVVDAARAFVNRTGPNAVVGGVTIDRSRGPVVITLDAETGAVISVETVSQQFKVAPRSVSTVCNVHDPCWQARTAPYANYSFKGAVNQGTWQHRGGLYAHDHQIKGCYRLNPLDSLKCGPELYPGDVQLYTQEVTGQQVFIDA